MFCTAMKRRRWDWGCSAASGIGTSGVEGRTVAPGVDGYGDDILSIYLVQRWSVGVGVAVPRQELGLGLGFYWCLALVAEKRWIFCTLLKRCGWGWGWGCSAVPGIWTSRVEGRTAAPGMDGYGSYYRINRKYRINGTDIHGINLQNCLLESVEFFSGISDSRNKGQNIVSARVP